MALPTRGPHGSYAMIDIVVCAANRVFAIIIGANDFNSDVLVSGVKSGLYYKASPYRLLVTAVANNNQLYRLHIHRAFSLWYVSYITFVFSSTPSRYFNYKMFSNRMSSTPNHPPTVSTFLHYLTTGTETEYILHYFSVASYQLLLP